MDTRKQAIMAALRAFVAQLVRARHSKPVVLVNPGCRGVAASRWFN